MEGRGRKRTIEISTANPNKQTGTQALRNFTIPRKKRVSGQVLLEPCPEESREYTLIQSKLKESRLDVRKEHANDRMWKDVKLVHNEVFLKEFSEKRSDMRAKGRHGREMEERYCFLVESYEATTQIYQYGLRTGSQDQCSLGKPSHGVYLFKHIDVALKHAAANTLSGKNLIVFKVLFGKVKKVTPSMEWNKTVDPMVAFDCHMAKDVVSYRDGLYQQTLGSSVYLFDYNEKQELNQRPRQCMPYAVVSFASAISPSISPTKPPAGLMHGHLEHLKGCTVAKRRGKGENATVTFKRFPTSGCTGQEYQSQASRVDATPYQHNDLQNPLRFISQQLYMPLFPTAEHFSPSTPCGGSGIPWQNYTDEAACLSNVQKPTTTSSCENNTDALGVKPQTSAEKISTIVYSSRLVKDPRLSRPEMNTENKSSEQEKTSSVSESDEQGCQMQTQNQEMKNDFSVSCEKLSSQMEEELRENSSISFTDKTHESDSMAEDKTEDVPSYKLCKMKFQKYAASLKMTEDVGHKNIWSLEKSTSELKETLTEMNDQINKHGLDFQKNNAFTSPHTESPNNEMYLSTQQRSPLLIHGNDCEVNQSHTRHLVNSDVSNLTSTSDLEDTNKNNVLDADSTQNGTECKENNVEEKEPSTDSQIEHYTKAQDGDTIQAVGDLEVSEKSSEQGSLHIDLSENSKSTESTADSEPTLSNTIENCSEIQEHNIAAMDVANCVDISVHEVMESNEWKDQNGQSCTENHDREELVHSKPDNGSEMAIEVKRGEAQHNTFYYALYKRLQLDQLLPNSNGVNLFSSKPYLRPKDMDTVTDNHVNETEDLQLIVKIQSSQTPATAERPTLSDRFSKLRGHNEKLTAFIHMKKLANSCTAHLIGDVKCDSEALIASNDGVKRPRNNNAKLVQLMAQRYSADRLLTNGKRLRRKRSKLLGKSKSNSNVLCKISSGQLLIQVLRRAVNARNRYLLKEKKNCKTNLASKRSPCGRGLLSKVNSESSNFLSSTETKANADKEHGPHLNSDATSPSEPQSHNEGSDSQEENGSHILTDDTSCLNIPAGDRLGHVSQSEEQHIYPAKQSTDIACDDMSKSPSHIDLEKSNTNIKLPDTPYPVQLNRMETEVETDNISHQEKLSPIRCFDSNESNNDDKSTKEEHKEEKELPKQAKSKNKRKDSCDRKEIISDYNTGVYEDKDNPNQAVSSFCSDKTSRNANAKAQTAVTPDLPRVVNNEMGTDTETRILGDSAVDNSSSGVTKSVVDIKVAISDPIKSEEKEANVNIQKSELQSDAKCTDANDKDLFPREQGPHAGTIILKTLKDDQNDSAARSTENVKHLSEPTSVSRCQSAVEGTQSSWPINSQVETTAGFRGGVIKDAKVEDLAVTKDDLHLVWQGQSQNNFPNTSETHIISKLRDYLTKLEFSVKKQDPGNDSEKESQVPMAWITLDSTVHKHLLDIRHYNKQALADPRNQDTTHFPAAPIKHKQSDEHSQLPSGATKRRRRSKAEGGSPDITLKETIQKESHAKHLAHKDSQPLQIPSGVLNINSWLKNHGNVLQQNSIPSSQGSGNINLSSGEQVKHSVVEKTNKANEQALHNEMEKKTAYSVIDISSTLKLADHAVSLTDLRALQVKCKTMLEYFISAFEKDQNISFKHACISRELILEKYLDQPPPPVEVKFEAINSFLELQMMMEACHFVENKINFLKRKPRFRTLLWYDPSLYGELYKGTVGFQQQSSLFSLFQQYLVSEDYSKLQEYYGAVSTLHQQLQDAPDTSYYMYLKTKRERLEVEAALRNPADVKSFFLSVPVAATMNFGDTLESLEKVQNTVMRFTETPADKLPGIFDVGKAEHLSIICRYLHEKALFLKSHKQSSKLSWFGIEHLLYDASKVLVWNESMHGKSNEVLNNYKRSNPQIVYGVTETGVALFKKMDQPPQAKETVKITQPQQMDAIRLSKPGMSTERAQTSLNIQSDDGKKETHQPANKRPACPPPRLNFSDGGVTPLIPPSLPVPLGNPNPYTDFPQRSNTGPWRMPRNHIWDWMPPQTSTPNTEIRPLLLSKRRMTIPHIEPRTTSVTDHQNGHAVRQPRPSPLIVKPRPVARINHQPTIGASHHAELPKEQARPIIKPLPIQSFPLDTSVIRPPLPPLSYSNTSNTVPLHNNPTPISYPFFLFNGQTYSIGPSVPVPSILSETQYHPHPV